MSTRRKARLIRELIALSNHINSMLEDGSFDELSHRERSHLVRQVRKLYGCLLGPVSEQRLRGILAAAAVAVFGFSGATCRDSSSDGDGDADVDGDADGDGDGDADGDGDGDADGDGDGDADGDGDGDADCEPAGLFDCPVENPFGMAPPESFQSLRPALADIDADGDLDLIVGIYYYYDHIQLLENTGTPSVPQFARPTSLELDGPMFQAYPVLADLDADGDFDILAGAFGDDRFTVMYFENSGSPTSPNFLPAEEMPFGMSLPESLYTHLDLALADIDDDGDLDLFAVGQSNDSYPMAELFFLENSGSATAPSFAEPVAGAFGLPDFYYAASPVFADIDTDGDLDLFVGVALDEEDMPTISGGSGSPISMKYLENTGSASSPEFAEPVWGAFGLRGLSYSDWGNLVQPDFADIDDDGDLDLFVGTYSEYDVGRILFIENTGS